MVGKLGAAGTPRLGNEPFQPLRVHLDLPRHGAKLFDLPDRSTRPGTKRVFPLAISAAGAVSGRGPFLEPDRPQRSPKPGRSGTDRLWRLDAEQAQMTASRKARCHDRSVLAGLQGGTAGGYAAAGIREAVSAQQRFAGIA